MSSTERLDVAIARRGLAPSREKAQGLILAGRVRVDGHPARHAGARVRAEAAIEIDLPEQDFVSRGGVKLAGALAVFRLDPSGRVCVDVGASTGGFTDCLLQAGAAHVHAIDVGYGQLAWRLRNDPRVSVLERTNVRRLAPRSLEPIPTLAVVDASFISLRLVLPPTLAQLARPADVVALIKPQFEVGRERVERGGVVRDPEARAAAVESVVEAARGLGLVLMGQADSTLAGAKKGNLEIFVHLRSAGELLSGS